MPTQRMNAIQALTAELRESLNQLPQASPEQVLSQTRSVEQRLIDIMNSPDDVLAGMAAELSDLPVLFQQYVEQITRSKAHNARALAALGIDNPVYSHDRFATYGASAIPIAGTRPTSVTV